MKEIIIYRMKEIIIHRNAMNGRFVSEEYAEKHSDTTIREVRRIRIKSIGIEREDDLDV